MLENFSNKNKILHFAPEAVFSNLFKDYHYVTWTFTWIMLIYVLIWKKNRSKHFESFNLILCNHVIEHIENDVNAIGQIFKILKTNGLLILSVPGNWKSSKTIRFSNPDWNGHYRHYGLDIIDLLKKYFGRVETVDIYEYNNRFKFPLRFN